MAAADAPWNDAAFKTPSSPAAALEARLEESTLLALAEMQKAMSPLHVLSDGAAVWSVWGAKGVSDLIRFV